jgi:hypothetical protein
MFVIVRLQRYMIYDACVCVCMYICIYMTFIYEILVCLQQFFSYRHKIEG